MKYKIIYIAAAIAAMTVSCNKQEGVVISDSEQPTGTVRTERIGLVLADNPNTKVNVDGTTGAITWIENTDQIAVCIKTNTSYAYRTCPVNGDSSIEVDLANNQTRDLYAIYPATSAVTSYDGRNNNANSNRLRVVFPNSYNMESFSTPEAVASYCPSPMLAINDGSEVLNFRHLGCVLKLIIKEIPAGTQSIRVRFNDMSRVNGTYNVINPSSSEPGLEYYTSGATYIDFFNINASAISPESSITFNIPLPTESFSALTSIQVLCSANAGIVDQDYSSGIYNPHTITVPWGVNQRASGRKITIDDGSLPGTFSGYQISAFVYNSSAQTSYGSRNDLIVCNYYYRGGNTNDPWLEETGKYYFNQGSNFSSNGFSVPTSTIYDKIFNSTTRCGSTIGGVPNCRYSVISVTGASTQGYFQAQGVIKGIIVFPDGGVINSIEGITAYNTHSASGTISATVLNTLVNTPPYCSFFPYAGESYIDTSWNGYFYSSSSNGNTYGDYGISDGSNNYKYYRLQNSSMGKGTQQLQSYRFPYRLVKNIWN